MAKGYFSFVLHSHIPYVRNAGGWPFGEDILHEAVAETYVPLLDALFELKSEGVEPRLTLGLTPILLEQLSNPEIQEHFSVYVEEKTAAAEADRDRSRRDGDEHLAWLAGFYADYYRHVQESFLTRYERDLPGAFRRLQDAGNLDIITSAATHAYLPLLDRDSSVLAQMKTGVENYRGRFGRPPQGLWLPECGFRPEHRQDEVASTRRPGFEEFLSDLGLSYFFVDTHTLQGGRLTGKVAGDVVGAYGVPQRRPVPRPVMPPEPLERTTFRPYYVGQSHVAAFGRDERTGLQVWSATWGYPGDFLYREFHRRSPVSGLQYWRVTDTSGDLGRKQPYHPEPAQRQVRTHADHFASVVAARLGEYHGQHYLPGIVTSAYDTELFGHWWFEGVLWLKEVLRQLSSHPDVQLTTIRDYLDRYPPDEAISLPESSWGEGGGHSTWMNQDTAWMWPLVHNAELRMETIANLYAAGADSMLPILQQAAREKLLLESSDWPFLISTGQARDYATGRFQHHLARFNHLALIAERGQLTGNDRSFLDTVAKLDNPFPYLDFHVFQSPQ